GDGHADDVDGAAAVGGDLLGEVEHLGGGGRVGVVEDQQHGPAQPAAQPGRAAAGQLGGEEVRGRLADRRHGRRRGGLAGQGRRRRLAALGGLHGALHLEQGGAVGGVRLVLDVVVDLLEQRRQVGRVAGGRRQQRGGLVAQGQGAGDLLAAV